MYFIYYLHLIKLTSKHIYVFSFNLLINENRSHRFPQGWGTDVLGDPIKPVIKQHKTSTARGKELSLNTMKWLLLTIRTLQTVNKIKSN